MADTCSASSHLTAPSILFPHLQVPLNGSNQDGQETLFDWADTEFMVGNGRQNNVCGDIGIVAKKL